MSMPLVSIVVPCYNHDKYVQDCIQSIIDQDYHNIELIIIDDGSSDNSVTVINSMLAVCQKRFVRFEFRHRPNKGLCATLNEAVEWCQGGYISFLASDDMIIHNKTSIQVEILDKNKQYYLCSGSQLLIDNTGKILNQSKQRCLIKKKIEVPKKVLFNYSNFILTPTCLFRKSSLDAIFPIPTDIQVEDLYIFYKAATLDYIAYAVPNYFTLYRQHGSNTHQNKMLMYNNKINILNKLNSDIDIEQLKKLIYLESFYSFSDTDKLISIKILPKILTSFNSKYLYAGIIKLFFKWW